MSLVKVKRERNDAISASVAGSPPARCSVAMVSLALGRGDFLCSQRRLGLHVAFLSRKSRAIPPCVRCSGLRDKSSTVAPRGRRRVIYTSPSDQRLLDAAASITAAVSMAPAPPPYSLGRPRETPPLIPLNRAALVTSSVHGDVKYDYSRQ